MKLVIIKADENKYLTYANIDLIKIHDAGSQNISFGDKQFVRWCVGVRKNHFLLQCVIRRLGTLFSQEMACKVSNICTRYAHWFFFEKYCQAEKEKNPQYLVLT